jgi:hypothetical protein
MAIGNDGLIPELAFFGTQIPAIFLKSNEKGTLILNELITELVYFFIDRL